jgi:hypothetical protein
MGINLHISWKQKTSWLVAYQVFKQDPAAWSEVFNIASVTSLNVVTYICRMEWLQLLIFLLGSALTVNAQVPSFWGCPEKNIPMPDFNLTKVSTFNHTEITQIYREKSHIILNKLCYQSILILQEFHHLVFCNKINNCPPWFNMM